MKPVRWGVLSTATIARLVIAANQGSEHTHKLTGEEADAYRIEFDIVSAAIGAGDAYGFGRADAVDQAAVLEAVGRSAATGLPVAPPPSAAGA